MNFEKLLSLCERYGKNSNSFMALYPGFDYFESRNHDLEGVIAYVDTKSAWVAAGEPLAAPENQVRLLREFALAAADAGKRVLVIPVDEAFAETAESEGFHAILIGSEPTFLFDRYPKSGTTSLDVIPTAKQLSSKGAVVRQFKAEELSADQRSVLDEMTGNWLSTRKTAALGFLNQLHPWLFPEHKKYFTVELSGKVLAFLAAIPIKARKSWYLVDTIRREDSPPGTTELLLLQAMKMLRDEGAQEATMGVAPLSGIEASRSIAVAHADRHRALYRILQWIFEKGNAFYNFKPLFVFKMKFRPTVVRPAFLLHGGPGQKDRLSIQDVMSLSRAWLPRGIAHAAGLGMIRWVARIDVAGLIQSQIEPRTIVRSVPPSWPRLLYRCRLTAALGIVTAITYFTPFRSILLYPFLHSSARDFVVGMLCLVFFTGGLEYLVGTPFAALCYFVPMILSNPSVALLSVLGVKPGVVAAGGSLGPMGTAGGLYWFLRHGAIWLAVIVLIAALASNGSIELNRYAAVIIGIVVAKIRLRA